MYLLLSFLCGLIVSTMNIFNGQLSAHCGVYLATVIIHLIGLITFTLIMFLKKQEISFKHVFMTSNSVQRNADLNSAEQCM